MRAFLGIGLPAGVREAIAAATAQIRGLHAPVAWTVPKNLHLTLVFLGEIMPEQVSAVERSMRDVASGIASVLPDGGRWGSLPRNEKSANSLGRIP